MALAGCAALSAQGEARGTPTPTIAPEPEVTAASVATGSLSGGTTVSLAGSTLADVVSGAGGANLATSVIVDDTTVSFVPPTATDYQPANVAITLTKADGTVIDPGKQFTYQ